MVKQWWRRLMRSKQQKERDRLIREAVSDLELLSQYHRSGMKPEGLKNIVEGFISHADEVRKEPQRPYQSTTFINKLTHKDYEFLFMRILKGMLKRTHPDLHLACRINREHPYNNLLPENHYHYALTFNRFYETPEPNHLEHGVI